MAFITFAYSEKVFALVFMPPAFAAGETNDTLMPKGMWKDPATGLIWDRCSLGQTWDGATCTGNAEKYHFFKARDAAKKFKAWRVHRLATPKRHATRQHNQMR